MNVIGDVLSHAWNAFVKPSSTFVPSVGHVSSRRPDSRMFTRGIDRSIVSSLYNRIAIDVSAIEIRHCRIDKTTHQYLETIDDGLNECLTVEANIDQSGRDFIMDVVMTMCDDGTAAIVPIDTSVDPMNTNSYDIQTMRVGRIVEWYPRAVKISVYNDSPDSGQREEIIMPKRKVAIVQNPLYQVMNEPNSTLQRLIRKLNQLDMIDDKAASGKLDLIIQFPYQIKSEERRRQAEQRRKQLEDQLKDSAYGVAYTDGSEKVTQLNRSLDNHMVQQVQDLKTDLYAQLGLSENVVKGTASQEEMLNYHTRTLEPMISAICNSLKRTFLTKTARSQGQSIEFFRDPFRLVPVTDLANIAAAFTSNEIMSSNEFRSILGYARSEEPQADQLRNANINPLGTDVTAPTKNSPETIEEPTDDSVQSRMQSVMNSPLEGDSQNGV